MSEIDRSVLLAALQAAKPTLAPKPYLPAFTHFLLDQDHITTFDDVTGIQIDGIPTGITACVPGELLLRSVSSLSATKLSLDLVGDVLKIHAGRSHLKLNTLSINDFPFRMPVGKEEIELTPAFFTGLAQCLPLAGADMNHPELMGVYMTSDDSGNTVLYASNNATLGRYSVPMSLDFPADEGVLLPARFCTLLLGLTKSFGSDEATLSLLYSNGGVMARIKKNVYLFSKLLDDVTLMSYEKTVLRYWEQIDSSAKVPAELDAALARAAIMQGDRPETVIQVKRGTLALSSKCPAGEVVDSLPLDVEDVPATVIDPTRLSRALKLCSHVALTKNAVCLWSEDKRFRYLVATREA